MGGNKNAGSWEHDLRPRLTTTQSMAATGARLITYVRVVKEIVYLIDIYDKSDQSTISDKELLLLIDLLAEE